MVLTRAGIAVAALLALGAAPPNPLVRARQLYNQEQYDAAIAAAREAQTKPELADAAAVVLGRAHLERYRMSSDAADLAAARETLVSAETARLVARDRVELIVGLGELLYFEGHYGAAAELFNAALTGPTPMDDASREAVLDWWAIATDHEAQASGDEERRHLYARMLDRVERWAAGDEPSAAAMYWVAAAAAGRRGTQPWARGSARPWRRSGARPCAPTWSGSCSRSSSPGARSRSRPRPTRSRRSPPCSRSGTRSRTWDSGADYFCASAAASVAALSASCSANTRFFSLSASSACWMNRFAESYCARRSVLSAR
jgi:hypothetical protein